jgi:CRISPR-associated protein Csy1
MEPDDAPAHYTERLALLPGIGTCYAQPAPPKPGTRAAFGLPQDVPLFLCPQSLFKIHPDNDALFARALAAAADARLVIFEGRHPALTARYRARLDAALNAEGLAFEQHVIVLPQCSHPQYLELNTVCDAMLDTVRWSGGNTSLDALACGLPIVTLPGRFMRGRQSAGMLRLMGLDELVARDADDYVRIAARLVHDFAWRSGLSARILAARERIFNDAAPIAALGEALSRLAVG